MAQGKPPSPPSSPRDTNGHKSNGGVQGERSDDDEDADASSSIRSRTSGDILHSSLSSLDRVWAGHTSRRCSPHLPQFELELELEMGDDRGLVRELPLALHLRMRLPTPHVPFPSLLIDVASTSAESDASALKRR